MAFHLKRSIAPPFVASPAIPATLDIERARLERAYHKASLTQDDWETAQANFSPSFLARLRKQVIIIKR